MYIIYTKKKKTDYHLHEETTGSRNTRKWCHRRDALHDCTECVFSWRNCPCGKHFLVLLQDLSLDILQLSI